MFSISGYSADAWYYSWILITGLVSLFIYRIYGFISALTFAYVCYSGLRLFAVGTSPYANELEIWNASLSLSAAAALSGIGLSIIAVRAIGDSQWKNIWKIASVLSAFQLIFGVLTNPATDANGFFANTSMGGCFLAAILPMFFDQDLEANVLLVLFLSFVILSTGKNQPIALFFLSITVFSIRKINFKAAFFAVISCFFVGWGLIGHKFFDPSGRVKVWIASMRFWKEHTNHFLGFGLGTYFYIGPKISLPLMGQSFLWLHSDWLQVVFENGYIGGALVFALFIEALWKSRKNNWLFTSLSVYGSWGIANFPLHNPISGLLGAFLLHSSLAKALKETHKLPPNYQE